VALAEKIIKPNVCYWETTLPNVDWHKYRSKEYWEYRKNWSELPRKQITTPFPIHIDIETTTVCNLLCPMCPRTIQIENGTFPDIGTMSMEMYKRIIDEGSKNGLCSVKLMSLGEPLLDEYIVERIKYAKEHGMLEIMFNTNATTLTEEMSHQILEAGLDSVFFSVDGLKEQYDKIRIGAHYETTIKNITNFMKIKNEGDYKHVQTRVGMVVLPGTEKIIDEYTKFWLPKVGIVGFSEWVEYARGKDVKDDYDPNFACPQPFQRMFVLQDGICVPCCNDQEREYIIGDFNKNSIKEIWNGKRASALRQSMIDGNWYNFKICKQCHFPRAKKGS